jgi:hypothetical protein
VKEREDVEQEAKQEQNLGKRTLLESWARVLAALIFLAGILNTFDRAISYHNTQQKQTSTPPPPTATPSPGTGSGLAQTQQQLLNDVKSRLGNTPYNDADIEALIKAGYLDPDTIADIIKGGAFSAFDDPYDAKIMNAMPVAERQTFVQQAIKNKYSKDQVRSALTQWSFDHLQNTGNIEPGGLDHIFKGEINANGQAVGYHYEGVPGAGGRVVPGTASTPDAHGVYTAQVEVNGVRKKGKGISAFFPKSMTPQDVVDSINEAYNTRVHQTGDRYVGVTSSGMRIQLILDPTSGKVTNAWPII